jgi:Phage tail assembly chaperone proteins, E, or 41 or 14
MADEPKTDPPKVNGVESPLVVTLRKAITIGDEEIKELKFREPTAADIERCGNPVNIDFLSGETPKMTFDAKAMSAMMSTLAAVPPSTIKKLNTRDWNSAAWGLASFFMPDL